MLQAWSAHFEPGSSNAFVKKNFFVNSPKNKMDFSAEKRNVEKVITDIESYLGKHISGNTTSILLKLRVKTIRRLLILCIMQEIEIT